MSYASHARAASTKRVLIQHTDQAISDFGAGSTAVTYTLNSNGNAGYSGTNIGSGTFEQFCIPATSAALLEVQVTVAGDAVTGSATGSYIALSSTRSWTLTQVGAGSSGATLTVTIREIINTANTLTRTITLDAGVSV